METDLRGEGSTELSELMAEFIPICIREYVAEVRRRDWQKCCPFKLSGDPQADEVLAQLILEDDNSSQAGNPEVHEARAKTPTDNIIGDDAANDTINEGPSVEATRRTEDARLQNETSINDDAIVAVNNRPQDSVIAYNAAESVNTPSESIAADGANIAINDAIAADGANIAINDAIAADGANIAMNDGPSESSDFELRDARAPGRNMARRKPQKFRRISDIYKDLGSCIYKSEEKAISEFSAENSEDDDEVTLGKLVKGERSARRNSERIELMKKKRKAPEINHGSDSELGSRYYLRTKRIMHEHQSKEFSSEDSPLSRGRKRSRETVEEDCAREVLRLLDGNQRSFIEEGNHSGPSCGMKRAQPPVETASGCVQRRIRESSPPTDNESMAVMQLLRLSKAWVNTTKTSSDQTASEDPTSSVAKQKSPSRPDGDVPPASGPPVEARMIDGTAGLADAAQFKSVTYRCPKSKNPAEFEAPIAKKFMRRAKVVKTV